MKTFYFLLIMTLIFMSSILKAQTYINFMGNCDSSNATLHYDNFAFMASDLLDSLKYTHVFSWYCNTSVEDLGDVNLQKQFFQAFYNISFDTINFPLNSMVPHLIYHKRDSITSKNKFIVELNTPALTIPVAYVYGSDNVTENPEGFRTTLSYLVSLDNNDQYASSYTQQELVYIQIYSSNGSYLYEMRDIDRAMVVGFKYYSPTLQTEKIKFIIPNN